MCAAFALGHSTIFKFYMGAAEWGEGKGMGQLPTTPSSAPHGNLICFPQRRQLTVDRWAEKKKSRVRIIPVITHSQRLQKMVSSMLVVIDVHIM